MAKRAHIGREIKCAIYFAVVGAAAEVVLCTTRYMLRISFIESLLIKKLSMEKCLWKIVPVKRSKVSAKKRSGEYKKEITIKTFKCGAL